MRVAELKQIAKDMGLKGYSKLRKAEFEQLIKDNDELNNIKAKYAKSDNKEDKEDTKKSSSKEAPVASKKKGSPWTTFLKEYSKKHGISYGQAMRDKDAKEAYQKLKKASGKAVKESSEKKEKKVKKEKKQSKKKKKKEPEPEPESSSDSESDTEVVQDVSDCGSDTE